MSDNDVVKIAKIKIMFVVNKMDYGGIETFLMNVIREINNDEKYEIVFLTFRDHKFDYEDEIRQKGCKIIHASSSRDLLRRYADLCAAIKEERPDVVHGNIAYANALAMKAAKKNGVRVRIAHAHSDHPDEFYRLFYNKFMSWMIRRNATKCIACGEAAGRRLFKGGKFEVVYNGIELDRFLFNKDVREKYRKDYGFSKQDIVIGHVGRLTKVKNHMLMLRILKRLDDRYKVVFVGDGELKTTLQAKAKELGINDRVKFLGNRNDTHALYNMFDLFLFPSIHEGLPVALVEAQANGLPIVASSTITLEVKMNDNVTFRDIKEHPDSWASTLSNIDLKRVEPSKIVQDYSIRNATRKLEKIYDEAITSRQRITLFISSLSGGGAERVVCNLANYLHDSGYSVDVITMSDKPSKYILDKHIHRVCLLKEDERGNKIYNICLKRKRLKEYMINNQDVSCYVAMLPMAIFMLMQLRKYTASKMIISERNMPSSYSVARKIMMKYSAKKCDGLVVQTKEIGKWYNNMKNKVVIPNAVNKDIDFPKRQKIEKKIVAVGRLEKQKNYPMLIRAFVAFGAKCPEYRLEIYGQGSQEKKIRKLIKEYGLGNKVEIRGFVENVSEQIVDACCFVMTSDYEGISNALIEAMCIGVPCVATDCDGGGARSLIKNEKNGVLIEKNNDEQLTEALCKIALDSKYAKRLSDNAMRLREELAYQEIYNKWLEFIERNNGVESVRK